MTESSTTTDYKSVIHLLATVLLTGISAWFAFGKEAVTQAEFNILEAKVAANEDITEEKALIIERISTQINFIIETLKRIEHKVDNGK